MGVHCCFDAFDFFHASGCLSFSHNARIAPSLMAAICKRKFSKSSKR